MTLNISPAIPVVVVDVLSRDEEVVAGDADGPDGLSHVGVEPQEELPLLGVAADLVPRGDEHLVLDRSCVFYSR